MTETINYLAKHATQLIDNGYRIVPIAEGIKYPNINKWQEIHATATDVERWIKQRFKGIGVICTNNPAIDIDVLDEAVANKVRDYVVKLTGANLFRIGKAPKLLIPFRADKPFKRSASKAFMDANNQKHQIEILGINRQFVGFATHPDTRAPYTWVNNESLLTTKSQDLPVLTPILAQAVIEYFESIVPQGWETKTHSKSPIIGFESLKPPVDKTTQELQNALDYIDSGDYQLWIKVGMGLHHQYAGNADGLALWDEWSAKAHNYDSTIIQDKWDSFRLDNVGNPVTGATILALAKQTKSDLLEAKKEEFYDRYVLSGGSHVIDLTKARHKEPMTLRDFKNHHADFQIMGSTPTGKPKQSKFVDIWHADEKKKKVEGIDYRPSEKRFYNDTDGSEYYNSFYFPAHKEPNSQVDLSIFYRHINYLFPEREESKWFLDWMAFNVQYPALRSPIAPLHISIHQGTGRGWLVKLLFMLLGGHNISKTDVDAFAEVGSKSQFNGYLHRSLVCVIEEMKQSSKHHFALADRIKSVITDEHQSFNLKKKPEFTAPCYTNLFFMSNHRDAIVLRPEDRRLNIFYCNSQPREPEYYTALYEWLNNSENISGLFHTLKTQKLDVVMFKSQRVMENDARDLLIECTTNDYEFEFNEFLETTAHCWITFEQLLEVMNDRTKDLETNVFYSKRHNEAQLKRLLMNNPATERLKTQIKIKGKPQRPWCLKQEARDWNKDLIRDSIMRLEEKKEQEKEAEDKEFLMQR